MAHTLNTIQMVYIESFNVRYIYNCTTSYRIITECQKISIIFYAFVTDYFHKSSVRKEIYVFDSYYTSPISYPI